jgi:hypothetical protein
MTKDKGLAVYSDKLLRASLVVECGGKLWLIPKWQGGWQRRLPLAMTSEARHQRLTPAPAADLSALGIPAELS